jgi:hypothetical protein
MKDMKNIQHRFAGGKSVFENPFLHEPDWPPRRFVSKVFFRL